MEKKRTGILSAVSGIFKRRLPKPRRRKKPMTVSEVCAYAKERGITYGKAVSELEQGKNR